MTDDVEPKASSTHAAPSGTLWADVVERHVESIAASAAFYQKSQDRVDVLRQALGSDAWQQSTALAFLLSLPSDVPLLLDTLVPLALSTGWAGQAREAIAAGNRSQVLGRLRPIVLSLLPSADVDDYSRLSEILIRVEGWSILADLVASARQSDDPDVQEIADDCLLQYGPIMDR